VEVTRLTRTSAFHLTLVYAALFAISVTILFGFIYWSTVGFLSRQTSATIEVEIAGLREQFEQRGLPGLVEVVADRVRRDEEGRSVYLFADASLRPLAGNLRSWPSDVETENGWSEFFRETATGSRILVRARILGVGPNLRLLVGRDIRELDDINRVFRDTFFWVIGATLSLALLGGWLMGQSAQRRLTRINRTISQVMSGDLGQRIPTSGTRDEYDELASNVNAMLGQIEGLLASVRHVGDNIAHDLRGPLTRLRNRLELLSAEAAPDRDTLADCVEQADALLDLFNALLRIARIEAGTYRSAFAPFDLSAAVRDVCSLFRAAAEERQIEFRTDVADEVSIVGDRELVAQALSNLLDNAVKYTPAAGAINVVLTAAGTGTVVVEVRDSGPGIPAEERESVLERFRRLDQARSQPGSGLGLALVKAVVEQHRGHLSLLDNSPGLRVRIELPSNAAA
jgi:signal transduction histidine kinase